MGGNGAVAPRGFAASPCAGSALGWEMRKMPAASGECVPAIAICGSVSGVLGATSGEVRKRGELVHAVAGDPAQHLVVGDGPGVAMGAFGGLLAGDAQARGARPVEDVPDPGDRGLRASITLAAR